ncbi:hypothetical protein CASFOL_012374 [Castilleja foliolosa]|uniref:Protein FAR1-RELATED SEQUENCE n=1 Tax=Castilleja foliolosa TaxID=1961234 RepID=A0ABD3DKL6_9LAMI
MGDGEVDDLLIGDDKRDDLQMGDGDSDDSMIGDSDSDDLMIGDGDRDDLQIRGGDDIQMDLTVQTHGGQNKQRVKIIFSPGKTRSYLPICEPDMKPYIGQRFPTLHDGIEFYRRYGAICGFDVRLGTQRKDRYGRITLKYVYCHREGEKHSVAKKPPTDAETSKSARRLASKRSGCKAFILLRINSGSTYFVKKFEEHHSHALCSERYKHFLKANRHMNPGHQRFLMNCARVNMGPLKSYRLYKEFVGGYSNVGCTSVEFKNFSRDLKAYGKGCDAQMLLTNLFEKRELSKAFYFDYDTDNNDHLTRLFWSDPIARRNYAAFGDVVSFDATYTTNRYNMIFAPFIGMDNHRRIVTFGAGLLSKEDTNSYSWLLEKFKHCMARSPHMIITDQDQGMKNAIERVLPETRHRYCMWHIEKKIGERVPFQLRSNKSFKKKIDAVIWSDLIEPDVFVKEWDKVLDEFNLKDHAWLGQIFDAREKWIPAYFRDYPLSGLFRTTSLSESVNSFFGRYLNKASNLVEFFMQYDGALEAQRHAQDVLNSETASSIPKMKTPLPFEKHAMEIYTKKIFLETQSEIAASCYTCRILSISNDGPCCAYKINDGINAEVFDVVYNSNEVDTKINAIPEKYILDRWTKNAIQKISFVDGIDVTDKDDPMAEKEMALSRLYSEFYHCVGLFDSDTGEINSFQLALKEYRESRSTIDKSLPTQSTKRRLFENFHRSEVPSVASILPPVPVYTKGSGKRIKSAAEIAMEISKKPLRLCKKCNKRTNHDSRNCDKFSGEATSSAS